MMELVISTIIEDIFNREPTTIVIVIEQIVDTPAPQSTIDVSKLLPYMQ
jgi:hypothetical protein